MPHVIVKLWPGKSEQQKTRLAEKITKDVMDDRRRRANDGQCRAQAERCCDTATPSSSGFDWAMETQQSDGSLPRVFPLLKRRNS